MSLYDIISQTLSIFQAPGWNFRDSRKTTRHITELQTQRRAQVTYQGSWHCIWMYMNEPCKVSLFWKKMKALFLEKNCEVSQIRSSTLNCLVVKESLLQTATETLLVHSSLTTNNSWPLLFSKRTTNTETHVSGGHVNINSLLVHYPSSGGREGPLFIRQIFE